MSADPLNDDLHEVSTSSGCQRCGDTEERAYTVIEGKDYCPSCAALIELERFHNRVSGEP